MVTVSEFRNGNRLGNYAVWQTLIFTKRYETVGI